MDHNHGLQYDSSFLNALPVLEDRNGAHIRALDAKTFADLHLKHSVAHAPDNVLFPFLHGLEGENHAQNTFFASSATTVHQHHHGRQQKIVPKVPKYRGLVWVVCEDDLERAGDAVSLTILRRRPSQPFTEDMPSSSSGSSSSLEEDEEDDVEELMLLDDARMDSSIARELERQDSRGDEDAMVTANPSPGLMQVDTVGVVVADPEDEMHGIEVSIAAQDLGGKKEAANPHLEGAHMHPVNLRPHAATVDNPSQSHTTLASAASICSSVSTTSSATSDSGASSGSIFDSTSVATTEATTTSASLTGSPTTESYPLAIAGVASSTSTPSPQSPASQALAPPIIDPSSPPLLTSTFRPKELLRKLSHVNSSPSFKHAGHTSGGRRSVFNGASDLKVKVKEGSHALRGDDEDWDFIPAHIPDGISLRNFGIQVPIYATLSDIVVYSPYGASPAALSLARRFQAAIRRKRAERMRSAGLKEDATDDDYSYIPEDEGDETTASPSKRSKKISPPPKPSDFLEYNVFVLGADTATLRREAPHLMMKLCGAGVPGGASLSASAGGVSAAAGLNTSSHAHAHTDGPDGHLVELGHVEEEERRKRLKMDAPEEDMDMVVDMDLDDSTAETEASPPRPSAALVNKTDVELSVTHNTVDFALREKEEMRDLTKASEIISLFPEGTFSPVSSPRVGWTNGSNGTTTTGNAAGIPHVTIKTERDPRVGQVFLGNSGDVPLAPDVPNHFRHAASLVAKESEKTGKRTERDWEVLKGLVGYEEEKDGDVIIPAISKKEACQRLPVDDPFNYLATNDPSKGFGFDICIECHDLAPFPSAAHMRAAEEHLGMLDVLWGERWQAAWREAYPADATASPPVTPPRPPPHANAVIHLPFPSSPSNSQMTMAAILPIIRFLEKWVKPPPPAVPAPPPRSATPPEVKNLRAIGSVDPVANAKGSAGGAPANPPSARRWSSVTSMMSSFPSFGVGASSAAPVDTPPTPPPAVPLPPPPRTRSFTGPSYSMGFPPAPPPSTRSRPLKVLLYSSDGYTESSVPALCLLMAVKNLSLPEAYLELQVAKRRSFFVYQSDLGLLRRVEARLKEERERERERERMRSGVFFGGMSGNGSVGSTSPTTVNINANGKRTAGYWSGSTQHATPGTGSTPPPRAPPSGHAGHGRPAAKSVSFAQAPRIGPFAGSGLQTPSGATSGAESQPIDLPRPALHTPSPPPASVSSHESSSLPAQRPPLLPAKSHGDSGLSGIQEGAPAASVSPSTTTSPSGLVIKTRPRANTSPWLPSLFAGDHQSWFNDPRFDGSFPSRVLPFLYLGNLNHASNVYMLHALGITHVVSVGECALIPPPYHMHGGSADSSGACHPRPGPAGHFMKGPGGHGSLWIEEREGRIKVLDIKGVCDDGIDTLEPQLEPICDWIDKARQEGGQVLVHCRVGVSRSATVTIAYVMKHLGLPLVDAYLIVRSRRLSVLIQPNMRLLYNLCGWEIKLAKERAGGDERRLRQELARTVTWPYLSKEVHALNEKYLHN